MANVCKQTWAAALLIAASAAAQAAPLPQLVIEPGQTSVSGLSSGGFMAVQLHVAYSATFKLGAGVVAGGPFHCAEGSILNATGRCMAHSSAIPVSTLVSTTRSWAASERLDPVANLEAARVYLFSGTRDGTVVPAVMNDLDTYYRTFVAGANIRYRNDLAAEHAMITDDYGSSCAVKASPYINDCDFDLAGEMLQHLYGPLQPRNDGTLSGNLVEFSQGDFVTGHGMADTGWVYVPQACAAGEACRLHVVLHGCKQNTATVGDAYLQHAGYNRWADSNRIVMLYPQTGTAATNGCWDWWGYDSASYSQKSGPQMAAIKAMVDRVSSGGSGSALPAPIGVGTSGATDTSMVLGWGAVDGAVGYNVYRGGAKVNAARVEATTYTDTGLSPGTSYQWTVTALDADGAESAPSAPASGSTTGTPPSAATCTTASNYAHVAAGRAHVQWGYAYANGSNQSMGLWSVFYSTTLKNTAPNYYVVGSCP
jgi:poly(3-hydroxybutyrate) depolymerase